jgi:hypothetical protein
MWLANMEQSVFDDENIKVTITNLSRRDVNFNAQITLSPPSNFITIEGGKSNFTISIKGSCKTTEDNVAGKIIEVCACIDEILQSFVRNNLDHLYDFPSFLLSNLDGKRNDVRIESNTNSFMAIGHLARFFITHKFFTLEIILPLSGYDNRYVFEHVESGLSEVIFTTQTINLPSFDDAQLSLYDKANTIRHSILKDYVAPAFLSLNNQIDKIRSSLTRSILSLRG